MAAQAYEIAWTTGNTGVRSAGAVVHEVEPLDTHHYLTWVWDDPRANDVRTTAPAEMGLPPGARILEGFVRVVVDVPGRSRIGDVADVRQNPPVDGAPTFTLDFGGMRSITELRFDLVDEIDSVSQWMGTGFAPFPFFAKMMSSVTPTAPAIAEFTEVMTERVLIDFRSTHSVGDVRDGQVVIVRPPPSVEILVNGERVWFAALDGTQPTAFDDGVEHALAIDVDLGTALQAALDAGGEVDVELRAAGPAVMTIAPTPGRLGYLRAHHVQFPDGPARTIEAPEEGRYVVDLPLDGSPGADAWDVRQVELRMLGAPTPPRIQPPVGPTLADDIDIVLDPQRTVLVRLPSDLLAPYATVDGIRVPVGGLAGGGELTAEWLFHDDSTVAPGSPDESVVIDPLQVDEGDPRWHTLTLAEPFEPDGQDHWLQLRAARGQVVWGLAETAEVGDLAATELRWRAASGVARALSEVADVAALRGAVRTVGTADVNRPIPALVLTVAGSTPEVALTPIPAGSQVEIELDDSTSAAAQGVSGLLRLELLVAAPGTYTVDSATILYTDPVLDEAPS